MKMPLPNPPFDALAYDASNLPEHFSTPSTRNDLSVIRRGLRSRRLACIFVLFECSRYGFDMSIEVDHRIKHLPAPRVMIRIRALQQLRSRCTDRTTPCESMKNVTRPSVRPNMPRGTLYALRASPDSSLNIGYCPFVVRKIRITWRTRDGGLRRARTVTLCFVAKVLTAAMASGAIPTTVTPESLNSTFSRCTHPPAHALSLVLSPGTGVNQRE